MPEYVHFRFLVLSPLLHPVRARDGDVIVCRPGHPTRPMVVMRRGAEGWRPVEVGPPNFGAIVLREDEGAVTEIMASQATLASHPLVRSA